MRKYILFFLLIMASVHAEVVIDAQTGGIIFNTSATERMIIDSSGNVGIGVSSANEKLVVVGNTNMTGTVYANDIYTSNAYGEGQSLYIDHNDYTSDAIAVQMSGPSITGSPLYIAYDGGSTTTSATYHLIEIDPSNFGYNGAGTMYGLSIGNLNSMETLGESRAMYVTGSNWDYGLYLDTAFQNYIAGNLGVGTTTPNQRLTVVGNTNITGNIYAPQICDESGSNCKDISLGWASGTGGLWTNSSNNATYTAGRVGIGTNAPAKSLEIAGSGIFTGSDTDSSATGLVLDYNASTDIARILADNRGGLGQASLVFYTTEDGGDTNVPVLYLANYKYIGMGTTTPNEKLTVVGNTNITGNLRVHGSGTFDGDIAVNGDDITSDGNLELEATGYVRVGDTGTPSAAGGDDDLYVYGNIETDGQLYVDGTGTNNILGTSSFDGKVIIDTNTGSQPFAISRLGTWNEALNISVDDGGANFYSEQDENSGSTGNFRFYMDDDGTSAPYFSLNLKSGTEVSRFSSDGSLQMDGTIDVDGTGVNVFAGDLRADNLLIDTDTVLNDAALTINDVSRYIWTPASGYGVYWDTTNNRYAWYAGGSEKGYVDISGNLQMDGTIDVDGTGTSYIAGPLSLSDSLDMNGNTITEMVIPGDPRSDSRVIGFDYDFLIRADEKYTVTTSGFSGSEANLFDGSPTSIMYSTTASSGTPATVEIDFGTPTHYWYAFHISSQWGTSYGFSSSFKIEKYYDTNSGNGWDSNCDNSEGDLSWATVADVTGFDGYDYSTTSSLGNGICKFKVSFRDIVGSQSQTQVSEIAAYRYYSGHEGVYAKTTGETFRGNVDIGTSSDNRDLYVSGDQGIGTTPSTKLHVKDNTGTGTDIATFEGESDSLIIENHGAGDYRILNTQQSNGIEIYDGTGGMRFLYNGAGVMYIDSTGGVEIVSGGLDLGSLDITNVDKITANTVDPVYHIGNESYATYLPAMIGVKEEHTFTLQVEEYDAQKDAYYDEINFTSRELRLFKEITDFGEQWEHLVVVASPAAMTQTGYEKDVENDILRIYAKEQTEVSLRLTAPRFDHEKWPIESNVTEGGLWVR